MVIINTCGFIISVHHSLTSELWPVTYNEN